MARRARGLGRAAWAVLAAAVAFGTTGTAQAKGPDGATPLGVGAVRILVGAVGLAAVVAATRRRRPRGSRWWPTRSHWPRVAIGGAGVAVYQPMFFAGTDRCGVAIGTIVALGSGPAFVGAWESVARRRRPGGAWAVATALALGGGGVLVASQDSTGGGAGGRLDGVGVVFSLAAGLGYATYALAAQSLITGRTGHGDRGRSDAIDSGVVMAWIFACGAVALVPALFVEPLAWVATGSGALMAAHLGLVTVTAAYLLYGYGLRSLATSMATTLTLAEPVTAAVAGTIVLGERLTVPGWAGAGLVVAGLALTGLWRPAPAVSAPTTALGGGDDRTGQRHQRADEQDR